MKSILWVVLSCLSWTWATAQHTLIIRVADADSGEPLIGANALVESLGRGGSSDAAGLITLTDLPAGPLRLTTSYLGYEAQTTEVTLPLADTLRVALEPAGEELEEITVTTTRGSRLIDDLPTRLEVLTEEELVEKAVMNSTNIAMLLRESTGILMQQTSALSANQSIRIQGLDGRYTQLLKDGFPLYGGFAGGLSIMQIPPLDLHQVEIIKGSASTLYGGGAIAGLVNLVTKIPEEDEPELSLMFNQTSAVGSTLNGYYRQHYGKTGATVFASGNLQEPYDPNNDDFSDIPRVRSLTVNPTFFVYPDERTRLRLGVGATWENRLGGDLVVIEAAPRGDNQYTEENVSSRYSTQLELTRTFAGVGQLTLRNSVNFFDREIIVPDYRFRGQQLSSFSELNYAFGTDDVQWIAGANLWTDRFEETPFADDAVRDFSDFTTGAFLQNTWRWSPALALESGLRGDYHGDYGFFALPRVSLLVEPSRAWTFRLGGGLGYKSPTIFTEEAERLVFRNIRPLDEARTQAERSYGANLDINFRTALGQAVGLSVNNLLFYTRVNDPLTLQVRPDSSLAYANAAGFLNSRGLETNVRLSWRDFRLFLSYALIDAQLNTGGTTRTNPLTPKHSAGFVLMYENAKWRIGYEAYYKGPQYLSTGERTRDYWIMGLMGLRNFEGFSLFLNFENFVDARQSRYESLWLPPRANPDFREIWAPTDGFVINGGIKVNLVGGDHHHH